MARRVQGISEGRGGARGASFAGRGYRRWAVVGGIAVIAAGAVGSMAHAYESLRRGGTSPAAAALAQQQAASQQTGGASSQSLDSLRKAITALQKGQAAQSAAAALAASAASSIPNGITTGGLVPDCGLGSSCTTASPGNGSTSYSVPNSWTNITGISQTTGSGGATTVTISQNSANAIANWSSFNVGANTTVDFAQTNSSGVGQSTWTTLNRVSDPSANPSYILGHIEAPGAVYIINRNGIMFGGGAVVDTHALVAATLDVGDATMTQAQRDSFFLNNGIGSSSGTYQFSLTEPIAGSQQTPTGGNIVVEPGASIATNVVTPDSPGFVYMFGANVSNGGTISSPEGEVALAAAAAVTLTPGSYANDGIASGTGWRGTGISLASYSYVTPTTTGCAATYACTQYVAGTGNVTNSGLIISQQGITILAGDTIDISGVISADTAIQRESSVYLDAATSVDLTGTISIQPYDDGSTLPLVGSLESSGSNVQTFVPGSVEISGYDVTMEGGSLIDAPGATVTITGGGATGPNNFGIGPFGNSATASAVFGDAGFVPERVLMESGATIDVSGLQDVQLPADYNIVSFQPRGNEFANDPLNRNGALYGQTIYVNILDSGTNTDGTTWVGTPLADASGYVAEKGQNIYQLLTTGGSVNISTNMSASAKPGSSDVILESGSLINMRGGYVEFLAGMVPTTEVIGSDGHIYPIDEAYPDISYVGIAGDFVVSSSRWNVSTTYVNPLAGTLMVYSPDYIEGHDSGGLVIATVNPVLDGTLMFGSVVGSQQAAKGLAPSGSKSISPLISGNTTAGVQLLTVPVQASANDLPPGSELPSQGYLALFTPLSVVVGATPGETVPANFSPTQVLTPAAASNASQLFSLPAGSQYEVDLSAATLSGYNLSGLGLVANDLVLTSGQSLTLASGGHISVKTAGEIDIEGTITAHDGQIAMVTDPYDLESTLAFANTINGTSDTLAGSTADIVIGATGDLDASGLWVNDTGKFTGESGPSFINGGSISLTTDDDTQAESINTGNVILAAGSVLDASSGGYVTPKGVLSLNSSGLPEGSGGSVTLETYATGNLYKFGNNPVYPSPSGPFATVQLDGSILGYGFSGGGTLTLGEPNTIIIGSSGSAPNTTYLPTSLFKDGFTSYVVESSLSATSDAEGNNVAANGQITIAAGAALDLQQQNFSNLAGDYLSLPTGTGLAAYAAQNGLIVTLPQSLRTPANLTLSSNEIMLAAGSSIVTDPGAAINLLAEGNSGQPLPSALLLGSIVDPGGSLNVVAQNIWLGQQADIDLAGTFVPNALYAQSASYAVSGTLLAGGSVSFDTNANAEQSGSVSSDAAGFVVGLAGATIDVSGASGAIATTLDRGASQPAWSDGGSVTINTGTFLWNGTFKAAAGNAQGNNGTIAIGGSQVLVVQNETDGSAGNAAIAGALANAAQFNPTTPGALSGFSFGTFSGQTVSGKDIVSADSLGAFDTVYLAAGTTTSGGPLGFFNAVDPSAKFDFVDSLNFNGNVDWTVRNRLFLEGSQINPLGSGTAVTLNATYLQLQLLEDCGNTLAGCSFDRPSFTASALGSSFVANAQTIDVASAAFNFQNTALDSSGDIRLVPSNYEVAVEDAGLGIDKKQGGTPLGELLAADNLTLTAQRVYPESNVDFTVSAAGTIAFATPSGGAAISAGDVPLSAGSSLTVSAPKIVQDGNLFVPSGTLTLQATGATGSVTLGAGSITSVSLEGETVPFGETEDGTNWFYTLDSAPVAAPPAKVIDLAGANVSVSAGATLDLSGGGDLQAIEFTPGTGGSRDVLSSVTNPRLGDPVYALLPSQSGAVAASDANFTAQLGDAQPLVGQQIYLAGGNGIAAGYYTLYPAHYATLAGALRVVVEGSAYANPGAAGKTLPDGTQLIGGYFAQENLGIRSSGTEVFAVQTSSVWRQYSEIDTTSANAYFAKIAAQANVAAPALPMDGGRVEIAATNSLVFDATAMAQPASGGRGGELDISAADIDLVSATTSSADLQQAASAGYLEIDVSQLDQSGFDTILVGGTSSDVSAGTLISPTAQSVIVDTNGTAFAAPQIILVAQAGTSSASLLSIAPSQSFTVPKSGTGNVTVEAGSIIDSTGAAATAAGVDYVIGRASGTFESEAANLAALLGGTLDSTGTIITGVTYASAAANLGALENYGNTMLPSLLLVSNNAQTTVARQGIDDTAPITIVQKPGDSTGSSFGTISLSLNDSGAVSIASGAQVGSAATQNVILNGAQLSIGSGATVAAKSIGLATSDFVIGTPPVAPSYGITISPALMAQLGGAANLDLTALGGGVLLFGSGSQTQAIAAQNLTLDTPYLQGDGQSASISASGTFTFLNDGSGSLSSAATNAGASLTIAANEIVFGGGNQILTGFGAVNLDAASEVFAKGAGTLSFGAGSNPVAVTVTTPLIDVGAGTSGTVGTGSQFLMATLGAFTLATASGANAVAGSSADIGGNLQITAASIADDTAIQALSGTVGLTATGTGGAVTLAGGGLIEAGGFAQPMFDLTEYSPGGKVVLTANSGDVTLDAGSRVDVGEPSGGEVDINAASGTAQVNGAINLAGPTDASGNPIGFGGILQITTGSVAGSATDSSLTIGGSTSLDNLSSIISGLPTTIDITTGTGNLVLDQGHTLTAQNVTLTANDPSAGNGAVIIDGTIDASGLAGTNAKGAANPAASANGAANAGGTVSLWGYNEVALGSTGQIWATASLTGNDDSGTVVKGNTQRGGTVTLGVGDCDCGILGGTAGTSNIVGINIAPGALIDVTGGSETVYGFDAGTGTFRDIAENLGGTVTLRAPVTSGGEVLDYNGVANVLGGPAGDANVVKGASAVTIDGYRIFSTTDGSGFDGVIDPAGTAEPSGAASVVGFWCASSAASCTATSNNIIGLEIQVGSQDDFFVSASGANATIGLGSDTITFDPTTPAPSTVVAANGSLYYQLNSINGSDFGITVSVGHAYFYSSPSSPLVEFMQDPFYQNASPSGVANALTSQTALAHSCATTAGCSFNIQPGVELDNFSTTINSGAVTVASNWNLAAGVASNLLNGGSRFDCTTSGTCTIIAANATCGTGDTCSLACPAGTQCFVTPEELAGINDFTQPSLISNIQFLYRYDDGNGVAEPGDLTLRAVGNVNVEASISDGFFEFQDYESAGYQSALTNYWSTTIAVPNLGSKAAHSIVDGTGSGNQDYAYELNSWAPVPLAPFDTTANSFSAAGFVESANGPSPQATGGNTTNPASGTIYNPSPLATADLFPYQMEVQVCTANCAGSNPTVSPVTVTAEGSWSYRLTAGASQGSANPNEVGSLAQYGDAAGDIFAGQGNVIVSGHTTYDQPSGSILAHANPSSSGVSAGSVAVNLPTMIRTGTGGIAVDASRDVELADTSAPGVIYTAGVNAPSLPSPGYYPGTVTTFFGQRAGGLYASDVEGFLDPQVLDCADVCTPSGPLTSAAYPIDGGNIAITAGQDIIGFQNVTGSNGTVPYYQFYAPWLYAVTQEAGVAGYGVFGFYDYGGNPILPIQSSWWIQFGGFDQGVLSGGGNVAIAAGRDLRDFSVSLPTTGRVSGGLSNTTPTVTHVYDSGNLTVRVGRNLDSGTFYEGSGQASIEVGGNVSSDWSAVAYTTSGGTSAATPISTILAVDSGQIALSAAGSIDISGIINPAELRGQNDPGSATVNFTPNNAKPLFMDTYGADSAVAIDSTGGNITIAPTPFVLTEYGDGQANEHSQIATIYPATLDVTALSGNIATPRDFILEDSDGGGFNLLAEGNLDLTGGTTTSQAGSSNLYLSEGEISAGASLMDAEFNAYEPDDNSVDPQTGDNYLVSTPFLTHQDDWNASQIAHLYAVTGNIEGGSQVELNRPAEVQAGKDIVDLNIVIQNIRPSDVSSIIAGQDLYFTGTDIGTGIEIAGPGYLDVEAGRNLGPFLPAAYDQYTQSQQGIVSVGNDTTFLEYAGDVTITLKNGNSYVDNYLPVGLPVGDDAQIQVNNPTYGANGTIWNANFIGPAIGEIGPADSEFTVGAVTSATNARNLYLPTTGATIVALFGVGKGVDYQAVENTYINPANAASVAQNYAATLETFLASLGISAGSPAQAWTIFQGLSPSLQHVFVDQVYFDELQVVGESGSAAYQQYQRGYTMVNTLFPASYGYTQNQLGGGANGANQLVETGDLNLLHATIQTDFGGNVELMGPGGNILVGSTAPEQNPDLKLNNLGILTLDGGAVETFTDQSVLVNDSRVFTEQGGNILMWTSNGNLDAGKGAKTTASFPPLEVNFDQNDFESIDLGGLVTGAGIGVLATSAFANASDVILIAPRGTVDAGEAGIRSSGNLSIAAAHVTNASNIQVGGTTSGVPSAPSVNTGALSAAGNTAAAGSTDAAKMAQQARSTNGEPLPSIITVEVLGYGGGDEGGSGPGDQDQKKKKTN